MRIIAGTARGVTLQVPRKGARPTPERGRESLFSILGDLVAEASVLDLFAGSGALGLEALSRGADSALFIDDSAEACAVIRRNAEACRLEDQTKVRRATVTSILRELDRSRSTFDLVFADPPYRAVGDEFRTPAVELLADPLLLEVIKPGAFLCLEHDGSEVLEAEGLEIRVSKKYGGTHIDIFERSENP